METEDERRRRKNRENDADIINTVIVPAIIINSIIDTPSYTPDPSPSYDIGGGGGDFGGGGSSGSWD